MSKSHNRLTFATAQKEGLRMKPGVELTWVDASAWLVYRAAWQHDSSSRDNSRAAALAKWQATDSACEVIDEAVQIFGGRGVLRGSAVERLYRHARAFRIFDGTSEIQQLIVARDLLRSQKRKSP
jgi:acyl-CoA dehydrogenase